MVLLRTLRRGAAALTAVAAFVAPSAGAEPSSAPKNGRFEIITYNVAGLPEGLSKTRPVANLPVIGGRLNRFDLALVQEDFAYPELLRQRSQLPYQSPAFVRGERLHFGDGLSLFSRLPARELAREKWVACHGVVDAYFDCLTPKGVAWWRVEPSPGVTIDVYNVHLDAGGSSSDSRARTEQLAQLAEIIRRESRDRPVVVGGDFNLSPRELAAFKELLVSLGLADVCEALRCGQSRLDRLLYRSSARVRLRARGWRIASGFRDASGRALSDHEPVVASFSWQTASP